MQKGEIMDMASGKGGNTARRRRKLTRQKKQNKGAAKTGKGKKTTKLNRELAQVSNHGARQAG
jgi:hypothetical protein